MEILYSDKEIAVCVKPVGLDSETEVPAQLQNALGGEVFTLHRLDKNVGGVMVYARTKAAAAALSRAIQEGTMVKEYVALVHGAGNRLPNAHKNRMARSLCVRSYFTAETADSSMTVCFLTRINAETGKKRRRSPPKAPRESRWRVPPPEFYETTNYSYCVPTPSTMAS